MTLGEVNELDEVNEVNKFDEINKVDSWYLQIDVVQLLVTIVPTATTITLCRTQIKQAAYLWPY